MIHLLGGDTSTSRYLEEILGQAGLPWHATEAHNLPDQPSVIVAPGDANLSREDRSRVASMLRAGGALIVAGGTAGLDDVLGTTSGEAQEGYLDAFDAAHPVTAGLPDRLHVFDSCPLHPSTGISRGGMVDPTAQRHIGSGVVVNRHGKGATVAIAANIAASVLHIQVGRAVHKEGMPAPDGTAPIDDGYLSVDDGVVLSWDHDRSQTVLAGPVPACPGLDPAFPDGDTPWFATPIADELRLLLLQSIAWAARETRQLLARMTPWPTNLNAVGHISHDSDGNLDEGARATLELLEEASIRSTWCHMWGPTYPNRYLPETFQLVRDAGHEIALHYNSLPKDGGAWGRKHLAWQADFVREEAGIEGLVSNKNHYLRWEGTVELFHWLAEVGIQVDQTKGPNQRGNVGYLHGSTLPWFPLDPDTGEFIDVLEIPLQFQDLWLTTPTYMKHTSISQAKRHQGVAHFLFHQNHLHSKPDVARAMLDAITDGRDAGLEWWTAEQINAWQRRRRDVRMDITRDHIVITSPVPIRGATFEVFLPDYSMTDAEIGFTDLAHQSRWNQSCVVVQLDLSQGETVLPLSQCAT